jgi:hypothetical protein
MSPYRITLRYRVPQRLSYPRNMTKNLMHKLTCGLLIVCALYSQAADLPAVGNLASQTAATFINHANDADALRAAAKESADIVTSEKLCRISEVSANLAVSAVTVIHMYSQVNPGQRVPALAELKTYLQFVSGALDAQISGCTWVASNARKSGITSEAERLRKDLRTLKEYLRAFQKIQPMDILPESPEGLQKPVF